MTKGDIHNNSCLRCWFPDGEIKKKLIIFFFRQSLHDQVETSDERWVHRLQNSDLSDLPPTSDPLVNRSYLLIQFKSTKLLVKGNLVLYSKDYGQQRPEKKFVTVVNLNSKSFLFTQFINLAQKRGKRGKIPPHLHVYSEYRIRSYEYP